MAPSGSWTSAPKDAFIVGLKELPESDDPVTHRHIFYAHAYKVSLWTGVLYLNLYLDEESRLLPAIYFLLFFFIVEAGWECELDANAKSEVQGCGKWSEKSSFLHSLH